MKIKTTILDEPLAEKDTPTTSLLILKGSFYIISCSTVVFWSNAFFLILPICCYFYLLRRYQAILSVKGIDHSVLVGGLWLALPSIPLVFFGLLAKEAVLVPQFLEIGASTLIAFLFFFLFGAVAGYITFATNNNESSLS